LHCNDKSQSLYLENRNGIELMASVLLKQA